MTLERDRVIEAGESVERDGHGAVQDQLIDDRWDGATLLQALIELKATFSKFAKSIDLINVFPVADGDAGANMLATIQGALSSASATVVGDAQGQSPLSALTVLAAAAEGAIDGARGNSGVILSQFFVGLASAPGCETYLDAVMLGQGMETAAKVARAAVAEPVDGTILTVMEAAAAATSEAAVSGTALGGLLEVACAAGWEALMRTPDQLDVLASAGVVDAGGYGFVVLLEVLRGFAQRREGGSPSPISVVPILEDAVVSRTSTLFHGDDMPMYCINFVLSGKRLTTKKIRKHLDPFADSLIVVEASGRFRTHLHSPEVEGVIAETRALGSMSRLQIDEIIEQVSYHQAGDGHQTLTAMPIAGRSNRSTLIIACASGDGLERVLRVMGAMFVLRTDQPGFDENARSVIATLAEAGSDVMLLPNDAGLIKPLRELVDASDSTAIYLIETRSVPQGLTALAARRPDEVAIQNVELMRAARLNVKTIVVVNSSPGTERARSTPEAEFLGIDDGQLVARGSDPLALLVDLLSTTDPDDYELLTIFSGLAVGPELRERTARTVYERFPWLELELIEGGQASEAFIAALE